MGRIKSSPKAPAQPQIVYVPTPVTTVAETPAQPSAEETKAAARTQSLLTRSRGRLGTIATSFRGFLGEKDNGVKRKTLLGE